MIDRLRYSMKAMQVLMRAQEVTAHNLANINTPGFKASELSFQSYLDEVNGETVSSVKINQYIDMSQGTLQKTGRPLDFAIRGSGFFQVRKDGQMLLKRAGHFQLNSQGILVDGQGAAVMGESGLIRVPPYIHANATDTGIEIKVDKQGFVNVNGERYGKISLVDVRDYGQIEHHGGSYFQAPNDLIVSAGSDSQILQGYKEMGNVDALTEMVDMMKNLRLFQSQQRVMRTTSDVLSQASSQLGKF